MLQFEDILIFDSWLFVSFFCLGIFGVCTFMYACGYVCIQWRANWKTVLFILLPPVEIKQIFTFVTFIFFYECTELMKSESLGFQI